jgi:hypothetical protein
MVFSPPLNLDIPEVTNGVNVLLEVSGLLEAADAPACELDLLGWKDVDLLWDAATHENNDIDLVDLVDLHGSSSLLLGIFAADLDQLALRLELLAADHHFANAKEALAAGLERLGLNAELALCLAILGLDDHVQNHDMPPFVPMRLVHT